ncbi:MAG: ABC transporter permease [Phycisphaerae bacterium]|nr:ABC transporter permease [Phycisphaerae bacterium]
MYQSLLNRRYLTSKVMPLLAASAVMLCTAMVLVVWSVMGGFLSMLLVSGRALIGDVTITWPTSGFSYYDDLATRLEADPMVEAASPTIETFGLISLPDGRRDGVMIKGVDGPSYNRVTGYADTLWWRPLDRPLRKDAKRQDPRLEARDADLLRRLYEGGLVLREIERGSDREKGPLGRRPAIVTGIEVTGFNYRAPEGYYLPARRRFAKADGSDEFVGGFMPTQSLTLTVLPLNQRGGAIDVVARKLPVANEFRSGLYEIDRKTVLIELGELQRMLRMDAARGLAGGIDRYAIERRDSQPAGAGEASGGTEFFPEPRTTGDQPARITTLLVKAKPGFSPDQLSRRCEEIYATFAAAHAGEVPPAEAMRTGGQIATWEARHADMIAAVKKETGLVLFLLGFISLTAVFLILAIFWAMVSEKTRDIGVLRAIGAGRAGVAWLWLRYGLAIGVIGTIGGGALAYAVVLNINSIHEWMGRALGFQIWDPKVYYFTDIPSKVDLDKAVIVLLGGVLFSVAGALWPAVRAARMDPVRSLRFE